MGKISLRVYDQEIEALIVQGQRIDEAIAHCAHILEVYPRHLETHRLLAKAYLEAKRYEQAVDGFERVLASVPEDFVSHVGLSVIDADSGRLDDAIWHMERAFEAQPSNAAIQAELQRLFGRRDGVEPPKIRLTRGALAHMYMQGQLYSQAISEAKAVLMHDSKRADMQCLLAKAHFSNGQREEAIRICLELLGRYPYCLDANRLMAETMPGTQPAYSVQQFRHRMIELDPYAALARDTGLHTANVADSEIALDRLEYSGPEAAHETLRRAGLASDATDIEPDAGAPTWLSRGVAKQAMPVHGSRLTDDIPPFLRRLSRADQLLESEETRVAYPQQIESMPEGRPSEFPPWIRALASPEKSKAAIEGVEALSDPPDWLRKVGGGQSAGGEPSAAESMNSTKEPHQDFESRVHDATVVRPEQVFRRFEPERSAIVGSSGPSPQENDDAQAWLDNLSAKHSREPDRPLSDSEGLESSAIVSDQGQSLSGSDPSGMHRKNVGTTGYGREAPGPDADSTDGGAAFDRESRLEGIGDSEGKGTEGENAWTPIMEEPDAPHWLVDAEPNTVGSSADDAEAAWSGRDPSQTDQSVSDELRESRLESEANVDQLDRNEGLDAEESLSHLEMSSQDDVPPWLRADVETQPQSTEGTRPTDWQRLEQDEWSGADNSATDADSEGLIASEPSASESSTSPSATRQPRALPGDGAAASLEPRSAPFVPHSDGEVLVSVGDAQSALGRGNITAALDMYGKLIRKGQALEEIIRDLRDALYRYPVEVPVWQALGDAYMRANRLQEALDAYTRAEELLR